MHDKQRQEIASIYEYDADKIKVIGTGYNGAIFYNYNMKEGNAIIDKDIDNDMSRLKDDCGHKIRYIFAGKISEKKGVLSLIRALSYMPSAYKDEIEIVLAGGAGNEAELAAITRMAEQSDYDIRFLGRLNQETLSREYRKSDVFILPSFSEGLPLVLLEAMACGLKVICTDLPGIRDWLDETIPSNEVVYVTPPKMCNRDEAIEDDLPRFERELADAMIRVLTTKLASMDEVRNVSFDALSRKILSLIGMEEYLR